MNTTENPTVIDPEACTNYERTPYELEAFLLFSILVAGKESQRTSRLTRKMLERLHIYDDYGEYAPFIKMWTMDTHGQLEDFLREMGTGQYTRLVKCFSTVGERLFDCRLDLSTCSVEDLESVPGIGPKTARFFLLHSRPDQRLAVLDIHILREMAAWGVVVPSATPPAGKRYAELERRFLAECDRLGMDPATYDLQIWTARSQGNQAN